MMLKGDEKDLLKYAVAFRYVLHLMSWKQLTVYDCRPCERNRDAVMFEYGPCTPQLSNVLLSFHLQPPDCCLKGYLVIDVFFNFLTNSTKGLKSTMN